MQTAMSKPSIVNILLANQREVNKNELKELNNPCFCTGPNILQYILLYSWITYMSSVRGRSSPSQPSSHRRLFFLLTRPFPPTDWWGTGSVRMLHSHSLFPENKVLSLTFVHFKRLTAESWTSATFSNEVFTRRKAKSSNWDFKVKSEGNETDKS